LLGRVLPTQLNIKTASPSLKVTYKTVEEANKALREVGITDVMVNGAGSLQPHPPRLALGRHPLK
jgi:hypothetical protein